MAQTGGLKMGNAIFRNTATGQERVRNMRRLLIENTSTWTLASYPPSDSIHAISAVVLNGKIYTSTYNDGSLYVWQNSNWVNVAPQLGSMVIIFDLVVLNGKIYGGASSAGLLNSALYEWNGVDSWNLVSQIVSAEIKAVIVYNNKIYCACFYLFEWNGTDTLTEVAPIANGDIYSLVVYNSKLYGSWNGKLYEWNDVDNWVLVAPSYESIYPVYDMVVFNNKLYGCTLVGNSLLEWNGVNAWILVATWTESIICLIEYDSNIYAGDMIGNLLVWDNIDSLTLVAPALDIYPYPDTSDLVILDNCLYGLEGNNGGLLKFNKAPWKNSKRIEAAYYKDSAGTSRRINL
jgi:hypothetical protein